MSNIELSIIVCTRNRPEKCQDCISHLLRSLRNSPLSAINSEIIIIDQSDKTQVNKNTDLALWQIIYVRMKCVGISKARNLGIRLARGKYLLFTDDDCKVDENWVAKIYDKFRIRPEIDIIFGKVEADPRTQIYSFIHYERKHKCGTSYVAISQNGDRCFAVFLGPREKIFNEPCLPHANFGSSNNMACRREVFKYAGYFSEHLGAGTWGFSAEDTEIQYRWLLKRMNILYSPEIKLYHNNWLSNDKAIQQVNRYLSGMATVFTFYLLRGNRCAMSCWLYTMKQYVLAIHNCKGNNVKDTATKVVVRWFSLGKGLLNGIRLLIVFRSIPRLG